MADQAPAMTNTIIRNMIADYLGITNDGATVWELMGAGFNTLDENPQAQIDTKAYISDRAATSIIKGYQTQFPFDTDLIESEIAVMELYDIGRNQKQGGEAEREYIRVEVFRKIEGQSDTHPARRFRVAVEVSGITGAGAEVIHVTGNLNNVGDFVDGTFNLKTKTFIAKGAEESTPLTLTVPTAPQNFTATAGDSEVALSWSAPVSNGGSPITGYEVSSDDGSTWNTPTSSTGHTYTGLVNGTTYDFRVRANNAQGAGADATATAMPTL